ncbi:ABC transporter permease [Cryptosporangium aurantiacum]|uniref:Peptide/nickel transport system permease protein n=1 Tax=Cryptosporangium aurantiacum TaxID=134849 RepID=A0A1M7QQF2_9ACTN|nr:ABC transporter permease [Cryptosporangium aurantiacum]SHN33743.1 peptide/nickel transport system permease protein [Cryptosporangium aurantiacum]
MARFIVRRGLLALLTLFSVSVLTFLMFFGVPTSPAELQCGRDCRPAQVANIEKQLGLDRPIWEQYGEYMKGIVAGRTIGSGDTAIECDAPCLGWSFRSSEAVTDIVGRALPITLSIVLGGAVLWALLGVSLGFLSALRRGTWVDKAAIGFSLTGASLQIYFVGLLLQVLFVYTLKWLPSPTYTSPFESLGDWFVGMILPWTTLAFLNSAIYARLTRAQMIETLSEDFVRTARAKGLPSRQVYRRHALRAGITPIVTIFGLDLGVSLGGAVITEYVFGMPGLGFVSAEAARQLNLPVVMATVLLAAFFIVLMNVVVDWLYAYIDPRVRLG